MNRDHVREAGRVLMVGFDAERPSPGLERSLRDLHAGGVILFRRNLTTPETLAQLVGALTAALAAPPLLAIDQEGGRVSRLEPWIGPTPPARRLAGAGTAAVRAFAGATGRSLRALGFNLDFAPVVDLSEPTAPNGIGDRAFGVDPEQVALLAGAFLDGLQGEGVAGCLKHFPGLGDTVVDSHRELPTVGRDRQRLESQDLVPFRRLAPRAAAVMVGHGVYPALAPGDERPACLSPAIVQGALRGELGFRGLVATDDLEMGAVSPFDEGGAAAVQAIEAGCDLLLYCHTLDKARAARDALVERSESDPAFAARLREAAAAVERCASRWAAHRPDLASWAAASGDVHEACRRV